MKVIGLLLSLLILLGVSTSHAQKEEYDPAKLYSVKELKEDLLYTKKELEEYHPGLYTHLDKSSFNQLCDSLLEEVNQPMTEIDFYPFIQTIFARASEAHATVSLSKEGSSYLYNEIKQLPFKLKYIKGELFIHQNASMDSSLIKGTKIISINDKTCDDILVELLPQLISDGVNETSKYRIDIEWSFKHYYHLLIDQKEAFKLSVQKPSQNQPSEVIVSGITHENFTKRVKELYPQPKEEPFQLDLLKGDNTAVLINNDFIGKNSDGKDSREFNKEAFQKIKNHPKINHLVIDLRKNLGGDPSSMLDLISYLANEDIQLFNRVEMNKNALFFKKDGDGKFFAPKYPRSWRPKFKENRFVGNIYILTSGQTHSVTGLFTALMSQHTDAVMVGEETGGSFEPTGGEQEILPLNNTKLRLVIPTIKFYTNVSNQPQGRGTIPDHEVTQTYEDFISDTDTEMEFVLDLIKSRR